ncbi:nanos homolog 1 [Odontesthes bonariensis]|uniref:nanos homolog 1 n=1 Tax=Odontesthes bonariensis TaxID=219752 RepID=UPI003F5826BC
MERVDVQSPIIYKGSSFDMWHDYMNLNRLLERLCDRREVDREDPAKPKKVQPEQWSHMQSSPEEANGKHSWESSSASSLSDTSCSGTTTTSCRFCKQNGESARVYRSHTLRSDDGKVTCPILRSYTCPICEATGDYAHTRKYCPQRQEAARMLPGFKFW